MLKPQKITTAFIITKKSCYKYTPNTDHVQHQLQPACLATFCTTCIILWLRWSLWNAPCTWVYNGSTI